MEPREYTVRVNQYQGAVYMYVNNKKVTFDTPTAHKAGLALVRRSRVAEKNEFVEMRLNTESIHIPLLQAQKIGVALLRKADDADDFQVNIQNH